MWDYIVVGAGTAGCVVASQLTADPRRKVLLLEAGGRPTLPVKMPAGMVKLFKGPHDWAFESEPQAACSGQVVFTPRGKMLGGSANMNAQIHQWCHPADFDGWAAAGAEGWSWTDVAPVFRRMERWTGAGPDDQRRGGLGPMEVASVSDPSPISLAFVEAARRAGLDGPEDYNAGPYEGAWLTQLAHRRGERFSVYDAYLKPALKRPNLKVLTGAHVTRLILENGRAIGVETISDEGVNVHRTGAGVVMCAGAFGTPQILMLSGIGPASQLSALGLPVVVDRAQIGENLQDHPLAGLNFAARRPITLKSAETLSQLLRWLVFRNGLLATNGVEAMAFTSVLDPAAPDLELMLAIVEWRDQALTPPSTHAFALAAAVLTPRSRGRVWLKSPSPRAAPAIDFGLLTDAEAHDASVLLEGARLIRRLVATEPLASQTTGELEPSVHAQSDDDLLAYLKTQIQTVYHPCGTCRMGGDAAAPVGPDLKLRGVENCWVADASVMPVIPRGHPNAVVAMIAQRAADRLTGALATA
ncbi:GMC family oxidoreductase [Phenylobacterium sp.]|jgi:choline dehydrogenase|uniref:GMC family oxidoreductase n=1 Tax=Phenylobacterium sp. TaxID=1871053 RepID=UPI002F955A4C